MSEPATAWTYRSLAVDRREALAVSSPARGPLALKIEPGTQLTGVHGFDGVSQLGNGLSRCLNPAWCEPPGAMTSVH